MIACHYGAITVQQRAYGAVEVDNDGRIRIGRGDGKRPHYGYTNETFPHATSPLLRPDKKGLLTARRV
jgi:hypothetical protein